MPDERTSLAVVLAAGEGVRMRSALPKALHPIAGRSMLAHVLAAVQSASVDATALVVGAGAAETAAEARRAIESIAVFEQPSRRGTAHAALAARDAIAAGYDDVLILFGDTPLVQAQTLARMRARLAEGHAVVALAFEPPVPHGYGRLVARGDGALLAIREEKDASEAERRIGLCNAGLMALDGARALALLQSIDDENAQREYYLTSAVERAVAFGWSCAYEMADAEEVIGVNDRLQLAQAERAMQGRLRRAAMRNGATLIDPDSVFFSWDTQLGRDVVVEPNVFFGPGVVVRDNALVRAFSHLAEAEVAENASIGPFARLRPGARIGAKAKIGNFVEIKNSHIGPAAAVSHLAYVGDASVGERANIGAGAITCNYDGQNKFRTEIGARAFVGSNVCLVAPVRIGAGAYIGSGSAITEDVAPGALALARGRQVEKPGWAENFRKKATKQKE